MTETESFVSAERRRLMAEVTAERSELIAQKEAIMADIRIAQEKSKLAEEGEGREGRERERKTELFFS